MWRPSLASLCKLLAVGVLFGASSTADACLFPCFWGWGGYYAPPPVYGPAYGGPAYAPSPCGPGGCGVSPCGPGGCSSFYGPSTCCAPCGSACSCSPCGAGGCSPCGAGGCASGNCGVNYNSDMKPSPDNGPTPNKTYVEDPESMDGMPEDDFGPTNRSGTGVDDDGQEFPFREPAIGPDSAEDGVEDPPIAVPIEEEALPGADITVCSPVRRRTFAQARYRVPRVARMHVQPQTVPWLTPQESRLANR